jgi:hypothetical protein
MRGSSRRALDRVEQALGVAAQGDDAALAIGPVVTRAAVLRAVGETEAAMASIAEAQALAAKHDVGLELAASIAFIEALISADSVVQLPPAGPASPAIPLRARLAAVAIATVWNNPTSSGVAAPPTRPTLMVGPDSRWFRMGDAPPVDLSRRGPIRRILTALVALRDDAPGTGMDLDAVMAAGWPDQELLWESGRARVYTAIRTLRRFGLEPILVTRDDGYLLDPDVPLSHSA